MNHKEYMKEKEIYTTLIALSVWQWQAGNVRSGLISMLDHRGSRRTRLWVISEFAPMIADALFEKEHADLSIDYDYVPELMQYFQPWEFGLLVPARVEKAIERIHERHTCRASVTPRMRIVKCQKY